MNTRQVFERNLLRGILKFDCCIDVTGPSERVTIFAAPGTHCQRRLAARLKFDCRRNDTERVREVTICCAPGTHCQRRLAAKLKFERM